MTPGNVGIRYHAIGAVDREVIFKKFNSLFCGEKVCGRSALYQSDMMSPAIAPVIYGMQCDASQIIPRMPAADLHTAAIKPFCEEFLQNCKEPAYKIGLVWELQKTSAANDFGTDNTLFLPNLKSKPTSVYIGTDEEAANINFYCYVRKRYPVIRWYLHT